MIDSRPSDTAYLLLNTGSPSTLTLPALRTYLTRFLTDPRVINIPAPLRHLLVRAIIVPFRSPRSLSHYREIWTERGSILRIHTHELAQQICEISGHPTLVGMRYEEESISTALHQASEMGISHLILIPLFPHYAMSSYESAVAEVVRCHAAEGHTFRLSCVAPYYSHPSFIELWADTIAQQARPGDHLVLAFHGIPLSQVTPYAGDPLKDYPTQCLITADLIVRHPKLLPLSLTSEVVYQSRLGKGKWLEPMLKERLQQLPSEGYSRILVGSPSFYCDCLETLYEIGIEGVETFKSHGGSELILLSCPNSSAEGARALLDAATLPLHEASYFTHP